MSNDMYGDEAVKADPVDTSKQVMITIRLTAEERNKVKRRAAILGISVNEYVLELLNNDHIEGV